MDNEIDKNMVILHIENCGVSQKEEDDFYDGFILCNFEYEDVTMSDIYEEVNDTVDLLPQYTNVENIEVNEPNAIMSSSTFFIECVFKEEEDTTITETRPPYVELIDDMDREFQEEEDEEEVKESETEMETMTSSTSSLDTEEEEELENQLMYYKTSIENFECEIKLYEKMLSGLIYKNISLYKYRFIFVNNNNMYTSIIHKIDVLKLNKKKYEKTLEDILKLQFNIRDN
jgi:hypothetical protein